MKRLFVRLFSSGIPGCLYPAAAAIVWLITLGHLVTQKRLRRNSERFYRALFPDASTRRIWNLTWRQYFSFSTHYLDRIRFQNGSPVKTLREGWETILEFCREKRGALLLMSHIGSWEAAALSFSQDHLPLTIYFGAKAREDFDASFRRHLQNHDLELLVSDSEETNAMAAIDGYNRLTSGGFVAMTGDRVWSVRQSSISLDCLGFKVDIPVAPFAIAWSARVSLIPFFMLRTGPLSFREIVTKPIVFKTFERDCREREIEAAATEYLSRVIEIARSNPEQWYHFDQFLLDRNTES